MPFKFRALLTASFSTLLLASCGGGGSSSSAPTTVAVTPPPATTTPPPEPTSQAPVFSANVFEDENEFVAQCETPRTGTDPATNRPFVDSAGSELLEKFWLRSWNDRTYLFYDEVTDVDPAGINPNTGQTYTRLEYFDILRTFATTPSGKQKDEFHFTQDTAERFQRVSTGSSAGYGAQYAFLAAAPPRDLRVAFTEAGSPFDEVNVARGAKILSINGLDAVNGNEVDGLNAGLFPSEAGVETTFEIEDTPGAAPREVTVTSAIVASDPVFETKVIDQGDDKVAYMAFNTFGTIVAQDRLYEEFSALEDEGIDDLVLDLRYNGGGFIAIASQLGYMIAGEQTAGQTFDLAQFNDKHPTFNPVTGERIEPSPFYDTTLNFENTTLTPGLPLPTLNLNRVFILSTPGTCSASELIINSLRGIDVEVILVGDTTCGKPFGFFTTDNCGVSYSTVQIKAVNAKGFGDYEDGFTPGEAGSNAFGVIVDGCRMGDDFSAQLGDTEEALLSSALTFRSTGSCPAATATAEAKTALNVSQKGAADAAGPSLFDSPIYKREMSYRQELIRDFPPMRASTGLQ